MKNPKYINLVEIAGQQDILQQQQKADKIIIGTIGSCDRCAYRMCDVTSQILARAM